MKYYTLKIYGKVQGVFFRVSTKEMADKLNIHGWVRNEPDGTVTIEAEGEENALEKFYAWLKKGPKGSRVEKIEKAFDERLKNFQIFEIKY